MKVLWSEGKLGFISKTSGLAYAAAIASARSRPSLHAFCTVFSRCCKLLRPANRKLPVHDVGCVLDCYAFCVFLSLMPTVPAVLQNTDVTSCNRYMPSTALCPQHCTQGPCADKGHDRHGPHAQPTKQHTRHHLHCFYPHDSGSQHDSGLTLQNCLAQTSAAAVPAAAAGKLQRTLCAKLRKWACMTLRWRLHAPQKLRKTAHSTC